MGNPWAYWGSLSTIPEQKALENSLRERESRYQIATEAGLTGVWDHDLQTGEMVIDTNLKNLLGFDAR